MSKAKSAAATAKRAPAQPPQPLRWSQRLARNRTFWRDLGGLALIALGTITLLTVLGWNAGGIIAAWAAFLRQAFGAGAVLLGVSMIAAGVPMVLNTRITSSADLLGAIIGAEVAFLALLGLIHSLTSSADGLAAAQSGATGGATGWVLARLVWDVLGSDEGLARLASIVLLVGAVRRRRVHGRSAAADAAQTGNVRRNAGLRTHRGDRPFAGGNRGRVAPQAGSARGGSPVAATHQVAAGRRQVAADHHQERGKEGRRGGQKESTQETGRARQHTSADQPAQADQGSEKQRCRCATPGRRDRERHWPTSAWPARWSKSAAARPSPSSASSRATWSARGRTAKSACRRFASARSPACTTTSPWRSRRRRSGSRRPSPGAAWSASKCPTSASAWSTCAG